MKVPPRLSVLLASEAPIGIVFRRGPSKLVRVIWWDRSTDQFKPKQWFRGRIYEYRSDLSPDGRFMIYFAMGGLARAIPATGGTWTAISRVPSLTAIALWGQGDTWGGGGMFTSNRSFWLDADANTFAIRKTNLLSRDAKRPAESRETRDGWMRPPGSEGILEKRFRHGWILRRIGKRAVSYRYELEQPEDGTRLSFPAWQWAEWDRHRLVWTEGGYLRAASLGAHRLRNPKTLCDFNGMGPAGENS